MTMEFITYLRTRQFLNTCLKNQHDTGIRLQKSDLRRFSVSGADLYHLQQKGLIQATETGYRVTEPGKVDLSLITRQTKPLTNLQKWMKKVLMFVDYPDSIPVPVYFRTFLNVRNQYLDLFFKVDNFSGRIHTPISSLSRDLRPFILLNGERCVSLDIGQMQPTLLASILFDHIGKNAFSDAIFEGKDVYTALQTKAGLNSRDEAKKRFFQIIFGLPSNELELLFEGENWIKWINDYKSKAEPRNPHTAIKMHSNLAWLLQTYEVRLMTIIWHELAEVGIYWLSVHDEIICRAPDAGKVEKIMNNVLSKHFKTFKINIK